MFQCVKKERVATCHNFMWMDLDVKYKFQISKSLEYDVSPKVHSETQMFHLELDIVAEFQVAKAFLITVWEDYNSLRG